MSKLTKVLKLVAKYGSKAVKWVKDNWRDLVVLAIEIIIQIVDKLFG